MNLAGTRVLVTRPAHQAKKLAAAIRDAQGIPVLFPVLAIVAPSAPQDAAAVLSNLGEHGGVDLLIFVSANAVDNALDLLPPQGRPAQPTYIAIGQATADAMREAGLSVDVLPKNGYHSEGLLALPELRDVAGKRVIIVRGEGGRTVLGDTLRERGAEVAYAEVYTRELPHAGANEFDQLCADPGIDLCIATSNEALTNLCAMSAPGQTADTDAAPCGNSKLLALPLLVISERTAALAVKLGFHNGIIVAEEASETALVAAIANWKQQQGAAS